MRGLTVAAAFGVTMLAASGYVESAQAPAAAAPQISSHRSRIMEITGSPRLCAAHAMIEETINPPIQKEKLTAAPIRRMSVMTLARPMG